MRYALVFLSLAVFAFAFTHANAANTINWTFYGPGAGGQMQGSMSAASNNLEGTNAIRTLDDVRTGKSKYVTLASASVMKGKFFCIGTVTYTSPPNNGGDGKTHTLENVVGYVHDTGCAFNGTCSCSFLPQYCNRQPRTDKMDIAVGNFTGYDGSFAMNFITKNPNKAPASWTQIAGLPAAGSQPSAGNPCGGTVKEDGAGSPATYTPPTNSTPNNPLTQILKGATQGFSQQQYPQPQPYQAIPAQTSGSVSTGGSSVTPIPTVTVIPTQGVPSQYQTYPAYPTNTPYPQPYTGSQGPGDSIITQLFQSAPATSGIRVLQNAAQTIANVVQPAPGNTGTQPSSQPNGRPTVLPLIVRDESNVSLMDVSQYEQQAQAGSDGQSAPLDQWAITQSLPQVLDEVVQSPRPESTFASPSPDGGGATVSQNQSATSPLFLQTMQLVLLSLKTILTSLASLFAGR